MQKNSRNDEQQIKSIAKTQINEAIKIISYYLKTMYFLNFYLYYFS